MKKYYIYRKPTETTPTAKETPKEVPVPAILKASRVRLYETGEPIPESLPDSYQPSQNCYNCANYKEFTGMCSKYDAPVKPNYWCASWTK